jgi:DNA-binding HxlR family transcriptional regulator
MRYLARGATIRPKNGKTLTFDTLGKWMRKHTVVILAGFDCRPAKQWVESEREATVQKVIDKTLARLEKKGIITR